MGCRWERHTQKLSPSVLPSLHAVAALPRAREGDPWCVALNNIDRLTHTDHIESLAV